MANAVYNKARQKFLEGGISWTGHAIKIQLLEKGAYTFSQTHEFFSSIPLAARISNPQLLGTPKTVTDGKASSGDLAFYAVPAGNTVGAYVIYRDTGSETTSPLIAYIDSSSGLGDGIPTNGGTINIKVSGMFFRI